MSDLTNFHNEHMSGNDYTILVLGNKDELNISIERIWRCKIFVFRRRIRILNSTFANLKIE